MRSRGTNLLSSHMWPFSPGRRADVSSGNWSRTDAFSIRTNIPRWSNITIISALGWSEIIASRWFLSPRGKLVASRRWASVFSAGRT